LKLVEFTILKPANIQQLIANSDPSHNMALNMALDEIVSERQVSPKATAKLSLKLKALWEYANIVAERQWASGTAWWCSQK